MPKRRSRSAVLTIPNVMSVVRMALIPLYLWLYCRRAAYGAAAAVLALSGVTDMLDGRIARQFGQETDVGRVLDPIADKLTQAALIVSLAGRYRRIPALLALFAAKETLVAAAGAVVLARTGKVHSARWYGKLSTFVLEASMGVLILFPRVAAGAADALIAVCAAALAGAGACYFVYDLRLLRAAVRSGDAPEPPP